MPFAQAGKDKLTAEEEQFRSSLKDAAVVLEAIAPYCTTVDELLEMINLGVESNGQLRLLIDRMGVGK